MNAKVILTKKLLRIFAAIFLWMALLTGVFSFATQAQLSGIFWIGITFVVIIIVFGTNLIERLEGREIPNLNLLLIISVLFLVGADEIYGLIYSTPAISFGYIYNLVLTVGYWILMGLLIIQFSHQIKSKS